MPNAKKPHNHSTLPASEKPYEPVHTSVWFDLKKTKQYTKIGKLRLVALNDYAYLHYRTNKTTYDYNSYEFVISMFSTAEI